MDEVSQELYNQLYKRQREAGVPENQAHRAARDLLPAEQEGFAKWIVARYISGVGLASEGAPQK